jgi:hypothetical protein
VRERAEVRRALPRAAVVALVHHAVPRRAHALADVGGGGAAGRRLPASVWALHLRLNTSPPLIPLLSVKRR